MGCARCEKGGTLIKVEQVLVDEIAMAHVREYELCVACYGRWVADQEQTIAEIYNKQDELEVWREQQERKADERRERIEAEKAHAEALAKSLERPVRQRLASTEYQALRQSAMRGLRGK